MRSADPELLRLLLLELERHRLALEERPREAQTAQRALHALKGSAAVAGEHELAAVLERLHRRAREGDEGAYDEAALAVRIALQRLAAGKSAVVAHWPVPPEDLMPRPLDPLVQTQYAAEVRDRLARIDEALGSRDDPAYAAQSIYRQVHTLKGAASAVGDEAMSWFCHGLEERLQGVDSLDAARGAMADAARWRSVVGGLLDDPEAALASLRTQAHAPRTSRAPSSAPSTAPVRPSAFDEATATIRVAAGDVDRLLDRLDAVDVLREAVAARADRARETAAAARGLRAALVEALRLIGPPRPWGAPAAALRRIEDVAAALGDVREDLDGSSLRLRSTEHALREGVSDARKLLSAMRQTSVGRIFARLTTAIESEARRSGRAVIVRTRGADEAIDRRIAEQLVEPCLQLVRNAVAHGIEPPEVRAARNKPPSGTIALGARRLGKRLSVTIEDDGAGVDVAEIRGRALEAGLVSQAVADTADDDTLLSLLFVPGFSTRMSSDLLAGRGIGLDIARSVTFRLGGAIRLSSRAGEGFSARIDLPIGSGVVSVLWLTAGAEEFALPAANARRVRRVDAADARPLPHLLSCLDAAGPEHAAYAIDLELEGEEGPEQPVSVGVDGVGGTEELLVRPVGPLVAGLGPYGGAIVRGDGTLRLALDAWAIAPRARAFVAAGAPSSGSGAPPASRRS